MRKLNFELTDFISFKRDVSCFNLSFQSELGLHFMLIFNACLYILSTAIMCLWALSGTVFIG